ncbi:DUF2683 family protein [Candidatus Woesearchaeota archaeon]|nr:DUF2683 family protein [Candidatus Woesearchaeota archaeon]
MVQMQVNLGEHEDRVLTIVKGKYGLKNKAEAVNFVIGRRSIWSLKQTRISKET